jgi:hypothetical protein
MGRKGIMGLLYGMLEGVGAGTGRLCGLIRSAGLTLGLLDVGTRQLRAIPVEQGIFHPRA